MNPVIKLARWLTFIRVSEMDGHLKFCALLDYIYCEIIEVGLRAFKTLNLYITGIQETRHVLMDL